MCWRTRPVAGITRNGEGFALEAGTGTTLTAAIVINSAGAWADRFAADFGEPVPLTRIYPSMIVTEPLPPVMTVNIGIEGGGIYARQVERGNCVVGGERALPLADPDFSRPRGDGALAIMNRTAEVFPALRHAQAIRFWSGTEAAMPDRNPVIGFSGTTPGLIHAFGFTGAGFQIAPGVGEVLAELVRDGRTSTPIEAFSISRFSRPATSRPDQHRTSHGSGADQPPEPHNREPTMITRRTALAGTVAALALAATGSAFAQSKTLYVGMNGGNFERVFTQAVFPAFEKANDVKIVVVPGTSSDILAKATAAKDKPQMHVMFLDDGVMVRAIGAGLCEKLKPSEGLDRRTARRSSPSCRRARSR
ncbi:Monomeric sarcosine oxidase [Bosea thiooxidans]